MTMTITELACRAYHLLGSDDLKVQELAQRLCQQIESLQSRHAPDGFPPERPLPEEIVQTYNELVRSTSRRGRLVSV